MININLTTEEARTCGSWARNIIKGLQSKLKDIPIIKKKAEVILMEDEQRSKDQSGTFMDFLVDFIDRSESVMQAKNFIQNYDKEVKKIEFEIHCWLLFEEQIKTQILQHEKASNKKGESGSSD